MSEGSERHGTGTERQEWIEVGLVKFGNKVPDYIELEESGSEVKTEGSLKSGPN